MCIILIITGLLITIFLCSCLRASTNYDRQIDDIAQEEFLREYKK